jgi:hypothetical protein
MAARKVLLRAIREVEARREPAHVIRDPEENGPFLTTARADAVPTSVDWRHYWEAGLQRATRSS